MGKTRDLFKKIRDTKGTFHAKMGSIKDRNGIDLTEAEDTKKRWQEYTEELHKKELYDPDNHDDVFTGLRHRAVGSCNDEDGAVHLGSTGHHLEPDLLECEVSHSVMSNSLRPHGLYMQIYGFSSSHAWM